jgi:hypothetical protein
MIVILTMLTGKQSNTHLDISDQSNHSTSLLVYRIGTFL